jgi:hypothetical protein
MTPAQTSLYWRLWQAACTANAWRAQNGRLEIGGDLSDPAQAVVTAAQALAADQLLIVESQT